MSALPAIDPMPPVAALTLPWDAAPGQARDPIADLAAARARDGDTFAVDGTGTRYLFLFSPAGVSAFYALPERRASKAVADYRMLLRKLPEELFTGRRTFAHDLFGNEETESYLTHLEHAIAAQLDELGDAGMLEVFAFTRRLGHRLGLASWAGEESTAAPRLDALIADLDRLDGSDAFVRPSAMARVGAAGKRDERAALARIERVLGEVLATRAGPQRGDFLDTIAARWADTAEPERTRGIAGDVVLLHLASMSNLFAAMGWTIVHLLQHPPALARVGDDAFLRCCALESIRLAQRSIMMRAALTTVDVDDGTRTYRVDPDVVIATMLPLTNTSAAPGLERYDPERWVGRRLRDEAALPARELVATFGHGRHVCPAQRFSLSAIARTVRCLVDAYDLEARFGVVRPYPDQIGGVARAADPCPVAYRRRCAAR
ncbi:MAG TPA: cytochrome [Candidatus Binatia bacterium]|nr:cytochrome [Candidatus Binatia bacterium]